MKRSTAVVLVLSGAMGTLFQGCSEKPSPSAQGSWADGGLTQENSLTNNTYVEGRGYYHAPYFAFFPFPYNRFVPGQGYYHGGQYTAQPNNSTITSSAPGRHYANKSAVGAQSGNSAATPRGGFTRSSSGASRSGFGS